MSVPEDIKLEALAKQRAERDKVLENLFPQKLEGIKKLRQERCLVECLNPYEKNVLEVNDLMFFLGKDSVNPSIPPKHVLKK